MLQESSKLKMAMDGLCVETGAGQIGPEGDMRPGDNKKCGY